MSELKGDLGQKVPVITFPIYGLKFTLKASLENLKIKQAEAKKISDEINAELAGKVDENSEADYNEAVPQIKKFYDLILGDGAGNKLFGIESDPIAQIKTMYAVLTYFVQEMDKVGLEKQEDKLQALLASKKK